MDLWRQDGITDPIYSFRGPGGVQHLAISQDASTIVANFQSHIKVIQDKNGNFEQVDSLDMQVCTRPSSFLLASFIKFQMN